MIKIVEISGPLVTAQVPKDSSKYPMMLETVYVGNAKLLGEIISIEDDKCKIQVYEETTGLQVGEPVELRGELLSVELGPGLMSQIFDGIQRPLDKINEVSPIFIRPGIHLPNLDQEKKWDFVPTVQIGEEVETGSKIGYVDETELVRHWVMIPEMKTAKGSLTIKSVEMGEYNITETVAVVEDEDGIEFKIKMSQRWPVKVARACKAKLESKKLFKTGQRVIDAMFPVLLGARVSTPGPFGAGKTFTQQQVAKYSNAQIVVYVGCGERGNEMTEMVKLFPTLKDPNSGKPLMDRTVLIANTSNMPIAAREASIYTGITIAEYFRDMGYDVVMMADSTSRWAEAVREISQRLGEMPSEEAYPAYMGSRIAAFYERAGLVTTNANEEGSVTVIGTVSPAGGDFSEPITQISLKNSQVFLALDEKLAAKRHYPSINWNISYSLYEERFAEMMKQDGAEQFAKDRILAKKLLSEEGELLEMVKLVGMDGMDNDKRLILEIAKSLREDFLQQNGFDKIDTYCTFDKMKAMMAVIIDTYHAVYKAMTDNPENETLVGDVFDKDTTIALTNMKYIEDVDQIPAVAEKIAEKIAIAVGK